MVVLVVTRGALGAIELSRPGAASQWFGAPSRLETYLAPTEEMAIAGAAVDGLHAVSMLALAMLSPRWRRPALTEAVIATALAGTGLSLAASVSQHRSDFGVRKAA